MSSRALVSYFVIAAKALRQLAHKPGADSLIGTFARHSSAGLIDDDARKVRRIRAE
jgi:hypothetical protein